MKANLIRTEGNSYRKRYVYACIKCGTEFWRLQCHDRINPLCGKCKTEVDRQRNKELAEIRQAKHDAEIRDKAIDEFVKEFHEYLCKENCGERTCVDDMDKCVYWFYANEVAKKLKGGE